MLITELTSPYEKCRAITYSVRELNKVVEKVYEVQHVSGPLYVSRPTKTDSGNTYIKLFLKYDCTPKALFLTSRSLWDDTTVEQCCESVAGLETPDNFIAYVNESIHSVSFRRKDQIRFIEQFAPEMVPLCLEARAAYYVAYEARQEAAKAARDTENKAFCDQRNCEAMAVVNEAIQKIISGGEVKSQTFSIYTDRWTYKIYSLFPYIAKMYGIKIDPRTLHWIHNSLAHVVFPKSSNEHISVSKWKSHADSRVIHKYMRQLMVAVRSQALQQGVG